MNLDFELNGAILNHDFYLVKNMNRNLIIGHDFLTKNGVRFYFDLVCLRVNNTFVPLIEDNHIASLIRSQCTVTLKPNMSYIIKGKSKTILKFQQVNFIKYLLEIKDLSLRNKVSLSLMVLLS